MYFTAHDNECPAHILKHYEKVLNLLRLFHKPTIPLTASHSVQNLEIYKMRFPVAMNHLLSFVIVQEIVGYDKQIVTTGPDS